MKKLINNLSHNRFIKRLKNKDFTIIARDCIGGALYHQLKLKFLSPTINLFFSPSDFNLLCLNLEDYINGELTEIKDPSIHFPVGLLTPKKGEAIRVNFLHYETFELAKAKWEERKKRINWNNIYVVSSFCYPLETETFSNELLDNWNKIKFKKVVLTDKKYGFDGEFVVKEPHGYIDHAWLLFSPSKTLTWKMTFNQFDFIKFLNE